MNPRKDVSFISNVSHSYPFIIPTHGKQTTSHTVVESDKVYPIPTLQSRPFMLEKPIQYTSPSFRPCCFYLWWGNILHRGLPRNKRTITQQFILKITLLIMKWIKHCHDLQWITYDFSSSFAPHSIHSHYTHSHELPLTLTLSYSNMACRKIPHGVRWFSIKFQPAMAKAKAKVVPLKPKDCKGNALFGGKRTKPLVTTLLPEMTWKTWLVKYVDVQPAKCGNFHRRFIRGIYHVVSTILITSCDYIQ